jgi:hypothetical protein
MKYLSMSGVLGPGCHRSAPPPTAWAGGTNPRSAGFRSTVCTSMPSVAPWAATAFLNPLIHQRRADSARLRGDPVQQGDPGGVLVRRGCQHRHRDDQAQHIHGQAALAAVHRLPASLPAVDAGIPGRGMHALGVQHH